VRYIIVLYNNQPKNCTQLVTYTSNYLYMVEISATEKQTCFIQNYLMHSLMRNLRSSKHAGVSLFEYNSECLKDSVHYVGWLLSVRFLLDLRFIHIYCNETETLYRENNRSNLATALWWLVLTSVQQILCYLDTKKCIPHDPQYMKYPFYCCTRKLTPRYISQTAGLCILN
jgi:hypothetical protein